MGQQAFIEWSFTPNRLPYTIAFILGIIGGMIFYHTNQTGIEGMISKNQYLSKVPTLA